MDLWTCTHAYNTTQALQEQQRTRQTEQPPAVVSACNLFLSSDNLLDRLLLALWLGIPISILALTLTHLSQQITKVGLSFQNLASAIDKERLKRDLQSKAGVSVQIEEISGDGKDVERGEDKVLVVISCRASETNQLIALSPELKLMYPSFQMAEQIYLKANKLPRGLSLIELFFTDKISDWIAGRPIQLLKDIAKITSLSEDTMDIVKVWSGSFFIMFRLPKSAAQIIVKKERELEGKFPTLKKIKLIGDLPPLSQSVSFAHMQHDNICNTHTMT